jgi:hypothetical protein
MRRFDFRALPDGLQGGADSLLPLQARRNALQPEGPLDDPVDGEAVDPSIDVARDLMRDEVFPDFAEFLEGLSVQRAAGKRPKIG